jgi:hypothetical protein
MAGGIERVSEILTVIMTKQKRLRDSNRINRGTKFAPSHFDFFTLNLRRNNSMRMIYAALAFGSAVLFGGATLAAPLTGTGGAPGAIPGGTVEDFSTAPAGTVTSITLSGVTYSGVGPSNLTIDASFGGSFNTTGQSIKNTRASGSFTALEVVFAGPVTAFAFNWGASDETWLLSAFDASDTLIETLSIAPTLGSNAGDYFGIAASGIARFTVEQTAPCIVDCPIDFVFLDDLTYTREPVVGVPVPAALSLFGLGLLGMALVRRR